MHDVVDSRARALGEQWRPTVEPGVYASPLDEDCVLYDPRSGQGYVLNATGARIWALCQGTHTLADIARDIAAAYQIDPQHALADVRELVDALRAAGLLATA